MFRSIPSARRSALPGLAVLAVAMPATASARTDAPERATTAAPAFSHMKKTHAKKKRSKHRAAPKLRLRVVTGPTAPIIHGTTTWQVPEGFGLHTTARTATAHTVIHETWTEVGGGYRYVERDRFVVDGADIAPPFEVYGDASVAIAGRIAPNGAWLSGAEAPRGRSRCLDRSAAEAWASSTLADAADGSPTLSPGETWEVLPAGTSEGVVRRSIPADIRWIKPGSCSVFDLDGDGIATVTDLRAAGSL
jgi:hypothetical protein